ncbi:MAG: hypothetical protein ACKVZH_08325 [Blastocatellia bacterium]
MNKICVYHLQTGNVTGIAPAAWNLANTRAPRRLDCPLAVSPATAELPITGLPMFGKL